MRFPLVEYLQWAKTVPRDVALIGASGVPPVGPEELGLGADDAPALDQRANAYGSDRVRERIAARYGVTPAQVYPTEGTSLGNFLALAALLEGGGHAVVEAPVYTPYRQQVEALADAVDGLPRPFEAGFAIDPDALEARLRPETRVVALTDLHNPSGVRTPPDVMRELATRAARHGACLLVDEVYRDFLYDEEPSTAARLAPNIIATSSLTKVYGLGALRFGWIIGPATLVERASRINDYLGVVQPAPSVALGLRALDRLPALTARSRALVETARPVLRRWLDTRAELETVWPEAGPIVFPLLAGPAASRDTARLAAQLLESARIGVVPGRFFGEPRGLRLGATAPVDVLERGLGALAAALAVPSPGATL
ncbi:MAG: pyridoxal phosphate-dependent aminotransferase [Candidatus Eiseniibacteriota bacterium]|jgi:hypothetical protein